MKTKRDARSSCLSHHHQFKQLKFKMFYDLNIHRPLARVDETLNDLINRSVKYGYRGLAITTNVDESIFEKVKKKDLVATSNTIPLPLDLDSLKPKHPKLYLYNRINIKITDSANIRKFLQCKEIKNYDLLSFEPENQEVLKSLAGINGIDIISYNPENKCDFAFNRKLYNQFVNQGVYFELMYGPGIADSTARKNLLILSHIYKAVGKSVNVIVTSGAQLPHQIRSPYDVVNFNLLFGLNAEQCKTSISKNCERLLKGGIHNRTAIAMTMAA